MKESEYYRRAFTDDSFRSAKLDELRYVKLVSAGVIWFCVGLGVIVTLYTGFAEGRWDTGLGTLVTLGFCTATHAILAVRLAALEAIDASVHAKAQGSS